MKTMKAINKMRSSVAILATLATLSANAQEAADESLYKTREYKSELSIKVGLGEGFMQDINGYYDSFKPAFSPMGGVGYEKFPTTNGWGFAATFEMMNKSSYEVPKELEYKIRYSTPCITIPVTANYNWYSRKHTLRWQVGIGAFGAVNLAHNLYYAGESIDVNRKEFGAFRDFDAGIALSFGCHFGKRWYIGMDWQSGLVPIVDRQYDKHTPPTTYTGHYVFGFKL